MTLNSREEHLGAVSQAVRRRLLPWFKRNRRPLLWRSRRTPYRVWVAELMLQQTQVDQAEPYYRRFMQRFPSVRALARAARGDVLKAWEGLGYYARARRLHQTARYLVEERGGRFPDSYEGWLALPGVGPYTAAAVGSMALGLDVAVVDGNVGRVLARVMAWKGRVDQATGKKQLQAWATGLLPRGRAADYNEAMMELGALLCRPRQPDCGRCPLRSVCLAHAAGQEEAYPVKKKKKRVPHKRVGAAVTLRRDGRILIAQRRDGAMLGGLWEFPGGQAEPGETMPECIRRELKEEMGLTIDTGPHLVTVRHAYSHFTIELHTHWACIRRGRPRTLECADYAWVRPEELRQYPFSTADLRIIECLGALPRADWWQPPRLKQSR